MIAVKRAYEPPARGDGTRILIDRVWPRGVSKIDLHIDSWIKDVAPSTPLRQWFKHDPDKWDEFRRRYRRELDAHPDAWQPILAAARRGRVTLVYGAHDTAHNNAIALQAYLDAKLSRTARDTAAHRPPRKKR